MGTARFCYKKPQILIGLVAIRGTSTVWSMVFTEVRKYPTFLTTDITTSPNNDQSCGEHWKAALKT